MVKIYNNISITHPRRRPKGRRCSYKHMMLLHLILMLGWYQTDMTWHTCTGTWPSAQPVSLLKHQGSCKVVIFDS